MPSHRVAVLCAALAVVLAPWSDRAQAASADLGTAVGRAAATAGTPLAVSRRRATGLATFVRRADRGDLHPSFRGRAAGDKADDFLARHGDLFGLADPARQMARQLTRQDALGWTHVRWGQVHDGVEVFGATVAAHLDPGGALRVLNGTTAAVPGPLAVAPTVPQAEAERVATVTARGAAVDVVDTRLVVYPRGLVRGTDDDPRLAWAIELATADAGDRELVMVDALTGSVLDRLDLTPEALTRQISQASLSTVVWDEGDPNPVPAGWAGGTTVQVSAWQDEIDGARDSYDFHGSLSRGTFIGFDGADALMATIHDNPSINCPNANWNGQTTNYCPGVTSDDVVSHEWGHAYAQYTAGFVYAWQPGALNESYSDVWGETIDQLNGRQTDSPGGPRASNGAACSTFGSFDSSFPATDASYRWLLGEDSTGFGSAIRDMWHPECRADPGRTGSPLYHCDTSDSGGVHTNSGIPNHFYALLADGGTYNSVTVTGIGLVKAANVLWRAESVYEAPLTDFADHADAVEQSCADLIGQPLGLPVVTPPPWSTAPQTITAGDCAAVAAAATAVELRGATPCPTTPILEPNPPPLCAGLGSVEAVATYDFETSLAPWTAGTRAIAKPSTYDGGTWLRTTSPPDGHPGATAFTADPIVGDCQLDDESGVSFLESPAFVVPADRRSLRVAFAHWIATEGSYDGGNVKISVNGGPYTVVPAEAFGFNPYNTTLRVTGNTDPLAGEPAWSGSDAGSFAGSWGESQLDLHDLAGPGDTVRLRLELGMDGCNGIEGWYVDDVRVFTCSADTPLCPAAPVGGCKTAPLGRAKLTVKDDVGGNRDRLQWQWSAGSATSLAEAGNPTTTTQYALCVWDWRSGTPTLARALEVPAGAGWKTTTHGAKYSDAHGVAGGVSRITVRPGIDKKAAVSLQAKGPVLALPAPASPTQRFAVDPEVTVQLVNSAGTCWTSTFTSADFKSNLIGKTSAAHVGP